MNNARIMKMTGFGSPMGLLCLFPAERLCQRDGVGGIFVLLKKGCPVCESLLVTCQFFFLK